MAATLLAVVVLEPDDEEPEDDEPDVEPDEDEPEDDEPEDVDVDDEPPPPQPVSTATSNRAKKVRNMETPLIQIRRRDRGWHELGQVGQAREGARMAGGMHHQHLIRTRR